MSEHFKAIQSYLPWIKSPLIVNGPMGGFAGPGLATAVTKAGGNGQIGSLNEAETLEKQFAEVQANFANDPSYSKNTTLPIGVGFLVFIGKLEPLLPVIKKYKPAVLWLFAAPTLDDYATWAKQLRTASPDSKIWVQAGSVAAALELASTTKPDVLVMQGADAGGHGYEKDAGIISLLPETIDALSAKGFGHIPILASGGMADGRGVAAALSLGACGAVLGTRFLSSDEITIHPLARQVVLSTRDGGQTTVRAKMFDEVYGPNPWPVEYDGRGIRNASYADYTAGEDIEGLRKKLSEALKHEDSGFGQGDAARATIWMGTGVGLVTKQQPAAEIVEELREGAKRALAAVRERL